MDEYGWPAFWAVVVIALLGSITMWANIGKQNDERDRQLIQALVSQGKDPISARCAVKGFAYDKEALVCQAAALKGAN